MFRVYRNHPRKPVTHDTAVVWIYDDETDRRPHTDNEFNELNYLDMLPTKEQKDRFLKLLEESGRAMWGRAYDHRMVAEATITRDGEIRVEFEGADHRTWTESEVKKVFSLLKRAKKRIKFKDD